VVAFTTRAGGGRPVVRVGGYAPVGAYAAIGDGRTVALVAADGSIDWLPLPTLAQAGAFAALLDAEQGGRCRLAPEGEYLVERRYLEATNVLETTFTTAAGVLRVCDTLTMRESGTLPWVELVRVVECLSGNATVRWSVEPRFGFGGEETTFVEIGGRPVALGRRLRLAVLAWDLGRPTRSTKAVSGAAALEQGDRGVLACVATDAEPVPYPPRAELEARVATTAGLWRRWAGEVEYEGRWRDAVVRSALALRLLVYAPSGALAAAATSALPERIGGERNFDYRFAWVRDASFALDALSRLGFRDQVHASLSWLLEVTAATHPRLQPFYGLDGGVPRSVRTLGFDGYRGSRPVRIGNSASGQLQLGNFGDLFDTVWQYVRHGNVLDPATGVRLAEIGSFVCEVWENEDSGLWELDRHAHYTISKIGCWVALRRAAALAGKGQIADDGVERWLETSERIRDFVETRCWSDAKRSYTFYAGEEALDCAVLLASGTGFADPRGERMCATIDAICDELAAPKPILYRYSGMEGKEGCFLACSFWMVEALARAGRLDGARTWMDELVELANDVGLYSEEIDPSTHELLGNFPQALTHLSLVRAAFAVADAEPSNEKGAQTR